MQPLTAPRGHPSACDDHRPSRRTHGPRVKRTALCVLLAVTVGGCGGSRHAGRQLPVRFVPVSLSALDDRDFALLGTVPCSVGRCYVIERTADGGRSFTRVPAPRGLPTEGTNPTLTLADASNSFVRVPFGWGEFWSTHDGGATWRRLRFPSVVAFTTARGEAYAVIARCTTQTCSGYRFARGPASASRWSESPLPFVSDGSVIDLAARGRNVWLLGTPRATRYQHDVLARSIDGGRTFVTGDGPCVPGLGGDLEPSSARVVWAVCATGMMAGASRSTDGGATFKPLRPPPLTNAARLAPASDQTAVLATNGAARPLYRTTDGGATWRPLRLPGNDDVWYDVVFTDARTGDALAQLGARPVAAWRTTDAGITWSRIHQQ
jgi:photosystem II stability/assembly factor-like uncharacterized protein